MVDNGKLTLAYSSDFTLTTINTTQINTLRDFFEKSETVGNEQHESTAFERSLRELVTRLSTYNFTADKLQQWGLARDYLLKQLIAKNKDQLPFLQDAYHLADDVYNNEGRIYDTLQDWMNEFRKGRQPIYEGRYLMGYSDPGLPEAQQYAWNSLSTAEREDLETLLILTSTGSGGKVTPIFNQLSRFLEIKNAKHKVDRRRRKVNSWIRLVWVIGAKKQQEYKTLGLLQGYLQSKINDLDSKLSNATSYLRKDISTDLKTNLHAYLASSDRIAALEGKKSNNDPFTWADLENALKASGKLTSNEIANMKRYWEASKLASNKEITNVADALNKLTTWSRNERDDAKRRLQTCYSDDEVERQQAQKTYRETLDAYIAGKASKADLDKAARAAYGEAAASQKEHLKRLVSVYEDNLESLSSSSSRYAGEYAQIGQELATLIGQTYRARLNAELAAREAEWNQARMDLSEKAASWREAAGLILERGRADWKAGSDRLRESYQNWKQQFAASYEEKRLAWDVAYLEGLKEKEAWAERATETAMKAGSEAMLALVGSDAEAGARHLDTLGIVGDLASGAEEARKGIEEVLKQAGIVTLSRAMAGSLGSAETIASQVLRGVGGLGVWDSGTAQVAAAQFTKQANQELASRQARLVAAQAREIAEASIKGLAAQGRDANESFRESMDETFVTQGSWRKEGQYYRKDVAVYSTLLDPVVTERASVQGYIAYLMQPVQLTTDLSDAKLAQLNASAIQALIGQAQK